MNRQEIFNKGWVAFGIGGVRDLSSTYSKFKFDSLLPLPPLLPNLKWLEALDPTIDEEMQSYRPSVQERQVYIENRKRILNLAEVEGVALPNSFVTLTDSFELQNRIPSCTACYFDLPSGIMTSPFWPSDKLIRFLNDQQVCVCWYLYIPHDTSPFVVCSSGAGDNVFLEDIDFSTSPSLREDAMHNTLYVAPSFDAFIYRFWIENVIWFKLNFKIPLPLEQLTYVRIYQPSFIDPSTLST